MAAINQRTDQENIGKHTKVSMLKQNIVGGGLKQQPQKRSAFGLINSIPNNALPKLVEGKNKIFNDEKCNVANKEIAKPVITTVIDKENKENVAIKTFTKEKLEPMSQEIVKIKVSPMSVDTSIWSPSTVSDSIDVLGHTINLFDCKIYRATIYKYLRRVEVCFKPKANYMKRQPDITYSMRKVLVDWLVEVAEEYKLNTSTLHMAVSFVDRFLSSMAVVRSKLQLLGTSALFIASKFEEIYPPDVSEFTYITDNTFTVKQVLRMEQLILKALQYDLSCPTIYTFLVHIILEGALLDEEKYLAMYICELTLLEGDPFIEYNPSMIASSAIALARHCLRKSDVWPENLVKCTGYKLDDLAIVISHLNKVHAEARSLTQPAIREKYTSEKYRCSSLVPHKSLIVSKKDESTK